MFDLGFLELLVIGVLGLVVLGPQRMPVAVRSVGRTIGKAKQMLSNLQQDIDRELEIEQLKQALKENTASLNEDIQGLKHQTDLRNSLKPEAVKELESEVASIKSQVKSLSKPLKSHEPAAKPIQEKANDSAQ